MRVPQRGGDGSNQQAAACRHQAAVCAPRAAAAGAAADIPSQLTRRAARKKRRRSAAARRRQQPGAAATRRLQDQTPQPPVPREGGRASMQVREGGGHGASWWARPRPYPSPPACLCHCTAGPARRAPWPTTHLLCGLHPRDLHVDAPLTRAGRHAQPNVPTAVEEAEGGCGASAGGSRGARGQRGSRRLAVPFLSWPLPSPPASPSQPPLIHPPGQVVAATVGAEPQPAEPLPPRRALRQLAGCGRRWAAGACCPNRAGCCCAAAAADPAALDCRSRAGQGQAALSCGRGGPLARRRCARPRAAQVACLQPQRNARLLHAL